MKRRTIFIELTSLLDVILIMIFILLTQARSQTASALEAAETEKVTAAQLEEELVTARSNADFWRAEADELTRQLITENLVLDNSLVLTVSCTGDGSILLESNGVEEALIPFSWDDPNPASNRLRALLLEKLGNAGDNVIFIVFQYDRSEIFHTEYLAVGEVIRSVKLEAKQAGQPLSFLEFDRNGL